MANVSEHVNDTDTVVPLNDTDDIVMIGLIKKVVPEVIVVVPIIFFASITAE